MTIEENKAVVRAWLDGWNARGVEAVDDLFSERFVDHQTAGDVAGLEPFKERLRGLEQELGRGRFREEEVIAEGDKVAARTTLRGTHTGPFMGIPPTGRLVVQEQIHILRFVDGKAVEHRAVRDDLGMLQQLGVIPAREQVEA